MIRAGEPKDLVAEVTGGAAVFFGAAGSSLLPSGLPAARPWRILLLTEIARRAGLPPPDPDLVGDARGLPLEGIFAELDGQAVGHARDLVLLLDGRDEPNPLHAWVSAHAGVILTTNFDRLLERALADEGRDATPWVVTQPWSDRVLYKLHGSTGAPETLRHTFRTVNQRFDTATAQALAGLTAGSVAVVGYAGADPDVVEILARPGGPLYWLTYPGTAERTPGIAATARHRDVVLVEATFDDIATAAGFRLAGIDTSGTFLAEPTRRALASLDPAAALRAFDSLAFRGAVADPRLRPYDDAVLSAVAERRQEVGDEAYHASVAARAFFRGGPWLGPVRGAVHYWLAARAPGASPYQYTRAGDTVALFARGLLPGIRALTIPLHRRARAGLPPGSRRAWTMFGESLGWSSLGRRDRALALLDAALPQTEGDMYVEGHLRRRRALTLAWRREPGWAAELDRAEELFRFEDRTSEVNDLTRTRAVCVFVGTGRADEARRLLEQSAREHAAAAQDAGAFRSNVLIALLRRPRLARVLLRIYG